VGSTDSSERKAEVVVGVGILWLKIYASPGVP
jgi:hypothetical protein